MTEPLDLALRYMDSFYGSAPLEAMEPLLADDLVFEGPLLRASTASEYLNSLRENPPDNVSYRLEEVYQKPGSVCLIYIFSKPGVETRMAQTFEIAKGKICRIRLVFDSGAL